MFEFLFKYRPVVFERGDLTLAFPAWTFLLALLILGLAVAWLLQYRSTGPGVGARDRWLLGVIRWTALAILCFALLRPALVVSTVVPRRNHVAVLLDDSRSLRVVDEDGRPRSSRLVELFGSSADDSLPDGLVNVGSLRAALEERFRVRLYAFDSDAARVDGSAGLRFGGERTFLGQALERVRQEMEGLPVSGIVLVTDGADNADAPLDESIRRLQAAGLPVYPIGLGSERIAPDVEVRRVELPRRALEGTTIVADVILSHAGLAGRSIRLDVEDEGRLVATRDIELGVDGELPVQIQFTLEDRGPRRLRFAVPALEGEAVTGNNEREILLEVAGERKKILYFEGVPRPELKFIRRAVRDDENLQLVTLLRSAEEKYLRQDVDDAEELAEGFPSTREELYRYEGLILGEVEASFFTHDQLQMMADFVGHRGGGLLVLGGRRSLAEGGYAGTPLEDALPVALDPPATDEVVVVRPEPTPAGRRHPALRVSADEAASVERWLSLPPLTSVNDVRRVKPGAVTLLSAVPEDGGEERILLAHQRYGRGLAVAFATQDSWLWQMHADIPLEDETHETLWRQLLRWLVHDVPGRARLDPIEDAVPPGGTVELVASVEDGRYLRVNGAQVTARVTSPAGEVAEVPLEWTVERDGEYTGGFVPREPGLYRVELEAAPGAGRPPAAVGEGSATLGQPGDTVRATSWFRSGPPQREPFGAGRRTELLERLAEETGGRFYASDDAEALAEDIRYTESGDTVRETRPLWDMPVLFLLLGALVSGEWAYRRWRGWA